MLGFQHDAPTPQTLNYSVGIQREMGWGTVLDVTYAGSQTRRIEVTYAINDLPYGTNFIDVHPENINPATGAVLPANFLRPYLGYGTIAIRQNTGETDYNSLQVQLNRRYIKGLQFALAYTLAKGYDTRQTSPYRPEDWFWAPTGGTQLHNLTISYTWDVPNGSKLWDNALTRGALDGWQLSGNTAFVSGDWAGVTFSTTDNFDFYGGGAGGRIVLTGVDPRSGDNLDPNPDGTGSYLNWAAFARPSGRLDLGNAPARFFRLPWIKNTDLSLFKNFQMGGEQADPVPLGGLQPVQHRELVGHQHHRAVQPGWRAGERELRQGDVGARPAHHAGLVPLQLLVTTDHDLAGPGLPAGSWWSCGLGNSRRADVPTRPTQRSPNGTSPSNTQRPKEPGVVRFGSASPRGGPCRGISCLVRQRGVSGAARQSDRSRDRGQRQGRVGPDLTPADFELKEDGKTRAVLKVEPMAEPLSVAVLLDDKGSDINEIRSALAAFVARVQGRAEVSLISVVPTTMTVFDYTSSTPTMMAGIQRLVWRAGPAGGLILGAVADAADELKRREVARPAIVVVTFEGEEFRSHRPANTDSRGPRAQPRRAARGGRRHADHAQNEPGGRRERRCAGR